MGALEKDISVRPTEISEPLKVIPNIPVGPNQKGPFPLISNRNFRNFGLNEKRPIFPRITAILTLYKLTLFVSFLIKLTCSTCIVSIVGSELGIGTFFDPGLYFGHGQHTVNICNQQGTLADYLIDIWRGITFSFLVVYANFYAVNECNERNVGIGELERKKEGTKKRLVQS